MDSANHKTFRYVWWSIQFFNFLSILLVFIWVQNFLGGFAWHESPVHQFNFHPVFAVLGLVLYGNGILIYRNKCKTSKYTLKLIHTLLLLLTFLCLVFSLKTVFDSHDYRPVPIANMYSFHSWIGLGSVILFGIQFFIGFITYLYPRVKFIDRYALLPFHQFFGATVFALMIAACHSGIMEKAKSTLGKDYQQLPPQAYVANFLGVFLTLLAISVFYLVAMPQFKSQGCSINGDQSHLTLSNPI